jgi:hypothetical protein
VQTVASASRSWKALSFLIHGSQIDFITEHPRMKMKHQFPTKSLIRAIAHPERHLSHRIESMYLKMFSTHLSIYL